MTKRIRSKRIIAILIVAIMAFTLSIQAFAAGTGYFTGQTGIMNSLYGSPSGRVSITSPILPSGSIVTGCTISFRVSAGSDPCYVYILSPDRTTIALGPYGAGTYTNVPISGFNGERAQGVWYIWVQTLGTVSTVTVTSFRVNYWYP